MDDRDELPTCRQPKKSLWQQFCEFFANPFGQVVINHVSFLTQPVIEMVILGVLSFFPYWCSYGWFGSRNERRLKRKLKKRKEKISELEVELEKLRKTKPDDPPARSNPCDPPCNVSMDPTQEITSAQPRNSTRRHVCNSTVNSTVNGIEEKVIENQGEIRAEVRVNIPDSANSAEVERTVEKSKILGHSTVSIKGSRILKDKVIVGDDILDKLSGLADSCTKVDNRVTVQLGDCRIFIRTDEGVEQLELDTDRDKLPVILYSSYAAGELTIGGLNLENATLKAATFDKSITLENSEYNQVQNELGGELGVCTWFGQLPLNNCDKIYVCAEKTISICGHAEVLVTSSVVKIEDQNLKTVVRIGIPTIIMVIYIARKSYQIGKNLINFFHLGPVLAWIVPLSFVILLPILPSSTENKIRVLLERVRLIFLVLYSSTWNFFFKQHSNFEDANNSRRKYEQESLNGGSKESDGDAIVNFVADNTSQNETNHTLMEGLVSLTESITQIGKTVIEIRNALDDDFSTASDSEPDAIADTIVDDRSSDIDEGNDPDWEWQAYQEYKLRSGTIRLKKHGDNQKDSVPVKMKPFEVIYGLKDKFWSERDYIRIFSPSLIEIIVLLIPGFIYARIEESLFVYASQLFHIREKLRVIGLTGVNEVFPGKLQLSEEDREKLQIDVCHLLRFMDKELANVLKQYSIMERGCHVSWDMLWAFFPVGTHIVYQCEITDEKLLGTVTRVKYTSGQGETFLEVKIQMWDYDCSTWKARKTRRSISQFDGDCVFSSLQTYPLRFSNDPKKDEKEFLMRGEVFCELSMLVRNRFMNYNGLIYMQKSVNNCVMLVKEMASGRVMVDLGSFAKMNPNYEMGSAEPPCEVLRDNTVVPIDITTLPERMYSPAMVYGFSFRLKKWGAFQVCSFDEIAFNESAFDALVMPERRKVLLEKLVGEYMPKGQRAGTDQVVRDEASSQQIDPIISKGEGCIILCYGPPGTGKTLTAESIAEKLHAPLWSLSVSELGTTPDELESYLVKVLDVATTWSAILLLDEADVYLEKRSCFDLTRTAMTGIFLRNLEYYRGVLFLTTNRIVTFDEAFRSRINMLLYYDINRDDRRKIWSTILSRVSMNITDDQLDRFSEYELNGRDIRNVVHRAMILSKKNSGGRLTIRGIQQSLDELVESLEVYSEKRASQSLEERTRSE